ncbi:MAG: hypothetical protein EA409_09300 [Saprospirales bacterium]|nr:MAG: hypothetical protein EA409_09300 [Saprospirales bacterium]
MFEGDSSFDYSAKPVRENCQGGSYSPVKQSSFFRHMASGIAIKKVAPQNKLGETQNSHSSCSELFLGRLLLSRACLRFTLRHEDNKPVYFLTGKLFTFF